VALKIRDHLAEQVRIVTYSTEHLVAPVAQPASKVTTLVAVIEYDAVVISRTALCWAAMNVANRRARPSC
jgi:hypothetical protein